jgi:tRNA-dihydrouridine synthase
VARAKRRMSSLLSATTPNELILPSCNRKIRHVMAPMVAASDYAFRCLVERHGADLTFTQMLHARNLVEDAVFLRNHLDFPFDSDRLTKSQQDCIQGMDTIQQDDDDNIQVPGPLIVQLAGHDPALMVKAFDTLMKHDCQFAGIDLNLGCPQGIARKGNYGAFLHEYNEDVVCNVLATLRRHVPSEYTVSCKIRLPVSLHDNDITNRIQRIVDTGVNFITVHGRTLVENKTKTGAVHVNKLKLAVDAAQNVPVICNGGVEHHTDIKRLLQETNSAAYMSSEALLETPNIFSKDSTSLPPRELFQQQVDMAQEYIDVCAIYPPLPGVLGGHGSFCIVKGHLFKFLHRYLHQHTDIRDQLNTSTRLTDAVAILNQLSCRYQNDEDYNSCPSCGEDSSWYRRHWAANSRVHQRNRQGQAKPEQTVEEKKKEMKQRISELRKGRLAKCNKETRLAV